MLLLLLMLCSCCSCRCCCTSGASVVVVVASVVVGVAIAAGIIAALAVDIADVVAFAIVLAGFLLAFDAHPLLSFVCIVVLSTQLLKNESKVFEIITSSTQRYFTFSNISFPRGPTFLPQAFLSFSKASSNGKGEPSNCFANISI